LTKRKSSPVSYLAREYSSNPTNAQRNRFSAEIQDDSTLILQIRRTISKSASGSRQLAKKSQAMSKISQPRAGQMIAAGVTSWQAPWFCGEICGNLEVGIRLRSRFLALQAAAFPED